MALAGWGCNSSSEPSPTPVEDNNNHAVPPSSKPTAYAPDSVLVRFKAATGERNRASILSRIKGTIKDTNKDGIYDGFINIDKSGNLAKIDLDKSVSVESALELLRKDSSVAFAEPNYIRYISAIPNDPRFPETYGLHNTGQTGGTADADIDAVEAWDNSVGSSDIVVGVVDTGVDYTHPDLAANMWVNPGEIPGNGIDDDANGVIDDVHGFNAITNGGDPMDDNDHGTHCSGTIGAVGGNGVGVAGVNWEVSIMAIKFLSGGGSGTTADAIEGINYAVGMKNSGTNLRVLSNSWGGGGFSQALADAITAANDADIIFIAAAGNAGSNNDSTPSYPASYEIANVVSVAATDDNDGLASFSNYGLTTVDLGAPGVDILSTTPGNTYSVFSGTSMATPHVAGAAALVLSANQTLTTAELKEALMTSGDAKPSLAGKTVSGKRLNVANALDEAGPPVPRFNMNASPASRVIAQGESAAYTVDITAVAGFTGNVALTVTSAPAINATVTATPSSVTAPGTSTVNVATTAATAPGLYTLTITGTSGALTKTRTVALRVRPAGTIDTPFPSPGGPIAIPDNNPTGITSTIVVNQPIAIQEIQVDLSITHTYIGDLLVTLTSPTGTTVTLHNRAGGSADNINQTFAFPSEFVDQQAAGTWTLHVDDNAGLDVGTLNSWTLHVIGVPTGGASFALAATPATQTIAQGATASVAIAASAIGTFPGTIALTATSTPAINATLTLNPTSITAPGASTLSVATSCNTAPGTYLLTITGVSGSQTKTTTATLTVTASGSGSGSFSHVSTDTPLAIPDNNAAGIASTITVADDITLTTLTAEVNITHTFIGDLIVTLVSPTGTEYVLHNRTGGAADNIHQTYTVTAAAGLGSAGAWQLKAADRAGLDVGTLDSWTIAGEGTPAALPPTAEFTHTAADLAVQFTDASTAGGGGCNGGSIASWAWSFGDGGTSTAQNPSHTYAAAGTYTVTLTVTDAAGLTDDVSHDVTVTAAPPGGDIELSIERITRNRETFQFSVDLAWTGATGNFVDLYRNDILVDIQTNDGAHRDTFRRYDSSYSWKLCLQQSTTCSNEVSVNFGSSFDSDSATIVTKGANGLSVSRVVSIVDAK